MKKRLLTALIAASLITAVFSGCSAESGESAGTTPHVISEPPTTVTKQEETKAPTESATEPQTEAQTTMSDSELAEKMNELGGYVNGKLSKATRNRLYDGESLKVGINLDKQLTLLVRVKKAADIANAGFELGELYRAAEEALGITLGTLSISSYEKDEKGYIIDETMTAWRSADGITGKLVDAVGSASVDDCSAEGLYEYFGDKALPFTAEEAADLIKMRMTIKAEGLLHEDENAVLVSTVAGQIAVNVRTYEEFLIPAAAEYAYSVIIPIAEKSEIPFSRINAMVYDSDDNGVIVQETMIGFTTQDGATGKFNSKPEAIDNEETTLEKLYEKYGEYSELIEQAKNNQRVERT